jgi:hypothetical protein
VAASVTTGSACVGRLAAASSKAVVSTATVVVSISISHTAAITFSAFIAVGVSISPIRFTVVFGAVRIRGLLLFLWVLSRCVEQRLDI